MTDREKLEKIIENKGHCWRRWHQIISYSCEEANCPIKGDKQCLYDNALDLAKKKLAELSLPDYPQMCKNDVPKFKVGDKVRCKKHGTKFVIGSFIKCNCCGEFLYWPIDDLLCKNRHYCNCNNQKWTHVPESQLELVEEPTNELYICENADECENDKGCKHKIKHTEKSACHIECNGRNDGIACSKCIPVSEYERRKKEERKMEPGGLIRGDYVEVPIGLALNDIAEGEVGEMIFTANLNFINKEDNMFSICNYIDEILTGLPVTEKILAKKKKKISLIKHQDEINQRINSEYWEDDTLPDKKRVLEILKEIEKEEK